MDKRDFQEFGALAVKTANAEGERRKKDAISRNDEVLRRRMQRMEDRVSRYEQENRDWICMNPECRMPYSGPRRRGLCGGCYATLYQAVSMGNVEWRELEQKGLCLSVETRTLKKQTKWFEKRLGRPLAATSVCQRYECRAEFTPSRAYPVQKYCSAACGNSKRVAAFRKRGTT